MTLDYSYLAKIFAASLAAGLALMFAARQFGVADPSALSGIAVGTVVGGLAVALARKQKT